MVGNDGLSKEAQNNATLMFFSLLRCMLASRRVLEEHKLTDRSFNWLLGEVETKFNLVLPYPACWQDKHVLVQLVCI